MNVKKNLFSKSNVSTNASVAFLLSRKQLSSELRELISSSEKLVKNVAQLYQTKYLQQEEFEAFQKKALNLFKSLEESLHATSPTKSRVVILVANNKKSREPVFFVNQVKNPPVASEDFVVAINEQKSFNSYQEALNWAIQNYSNKEDGIRVGYDVTPDQRRNFEEVNKMFEKFYNNFSLGNRVGELLPL